MFDSIINFFYWAIGNDYQVLTAAQMGVRTIIVYIFTIILVRIGRRRFLAKPSSFDLVLILILGSVISRAITGNVPFLPTLGAAIILLIFHTLFSYLTFYLPKIGALIKGKPLVLIKDGQIQWDNMKLSQFTERDLLSVIRRNAQILDPSYVKLAILERNGEISVIPKKRKPEIIEINVSEGIQTVKIELRD